MPDLDEHCRISKKRTGADWRDLHKWMDGLQKELGINHRKERHDTSWIPTVKEQWGNYGVLEFLYHVEIDNKITRIRLEKKHKKIIKDLEENKEKELFLVWSKSDNSNSLKNLEKNKEINKSLLEKLKEKRLEISRKKMVPAFLIFSNAVIESMALEMPTNEKEMKKIKGVGNKKIDEYGNTFLSIIKQYSN